MGHRQVIHAENEVMRVTAALGGGHVAEILHKPTGVNPLWVPTWPTIEPSTYDPVKHPEYGTGEEAKLLSGILGHNICLDTFGSPSVEEAAAGMSVHGEGPVIPYQASATADTLHLGATLPLAQLRFEREIRLVPGGRVVHFSETLENLSGVDRPIAWTQHVTLGPPFLEVGRTQFRISATRSKVIDAAFNDGKGTQLPDADFDWPFCPDRSGGFADLRVYAGTAVSAGFSAHLMNPELENSFFISWSPTHKLLFGYVWRRADFPWLGRWEENHLRTQAPWNGQGLTCGMEFGASPLVESRRKMVERGSMFGVKTYRWAPARTTMRLDYCAFMAGSEKIPESVVWDGGERVDFEF